MTVKDWIPLLTPTAAILSAFGAASLTRWWGHRKEKRDAKMRLFSTLMANRKGPFKPEAIAAFNLIDVVFHKDTKVITLWREYYAMLHGKEAHPDQHHKFLDLLSAMADVLGYSSIRQTDIDKFYMPKSAVDQMNAAETAQMELLRVLRNTNALMVIPRLQQQPQIVDPASGQPPQTPALPQPPVADGNR